MPDKRVSDDDYVRLDCMIAEFGDGILEFETRDICNLLHDNLEFRAEIALLKAHLKQKDIARELQINEYERIMDEHATRLAASEAKLESVYKLPTYWMDHPNGKDRMEVVSAFGLNKALSDTEAQ